MDKLKYPKGETVWTSYINSSGDLQFIITAKTQRDYYYLYELIDNQFVKLGRGRTPPELEEKYKVSNKLKQNK